MRKISGSLDRDAVNLQWAPDSSGVYFTADDHGTSNVQFAPLSGSPRTITSGTHMLSLTSVSAKSLGVGVRSSAHQPPDVVRFNLTQPGPVAQLTHVNDDVLNGITLGAVEEVAYTSGDGTKVQGWLVKPPSFDSNRKYPLIMEIHGGPHGMYNVGFNRMFQLFAANGYVVLYTNPRGSTGYGSAFGNAIDAAYPGVDYDDLMAGVDAVIGQGNIDSRDMFVGGLQRRRRAIELGHRPHRSVCGRRGAVSRDRLAELHGPHRHSALHLELLRRAILGKAGAMAEAVAADVRRQRQDPDAGHDGRARHADADAADRGVLHCAEDAGHRRRSCCGSRVSTTARLQAVELHAHAAVHDELVQGPQPP